MSTDGLVYDRLSWTWVTPEEMERRRADREERSFQMQRRQGELCAPMVIGDSQGGIRGIMSMADGRLYDSKSNMRRHYREAGVIEVGNDVPTKKPKTDWAAEGRKRKAALGRALSAKGFGA